MIALCTRRSSPLHVFASTSSSLVPSFLQLTAIQLSSYLSISISMLHQVINKSVGCRMHERSITNNFGGCQESEREKTLWLSHCEVKESKRSGSTRRKLSVRCPCAFRALRTHSSEPIVSVTKCALADFLGNFESKLRLLSITYRYICHLFIICFSFSVTAHVRIQYLQPGR